MGAIELAFRNLWSSQLLSKKRGICLSAVKSMPLQVCPIRSDIMEAHSLKALSLAV